MNSLLSIIDDRHFAQPIPATVPPSSLISVAFESVPFDQARWDAWVTKGHLSDGIFTEKVRTLSLLAVSIAVGAWAAFIALG